MELRQLQYFRAICETNSFTHAAERCYVSQSAISQQIRALERELGFDLITRKGVHPNSAYHLMEAIRLKNYFDAKIPGGVYSLFPDLHLMNGETKIF